MNILLTDGAGYIGFHTIIELDKAGHSVVVVDNSANSQPEALKRVFKIIG
jgi:UDP-glucose 4-epimerase